MSYSHRIFVYGPVGLLLLVILSVSVYWRVQADTLAARLDRANGGEIVPGIIFAFAEKSIVGFPFRLDAVLSGVTIAHRGPEGETAWRTEKLAIHAMTYGRPLYIFEAAGLQSFAQPPIQIGQAPRVTYASAAIARASAIVRNGRLSRFDLDLWEPEAKDATESGEPTRTLSAARAQFHALRRADDSIDVAMKIEEAKIGAGFMPALGGDMELADLRGTIVQGHAFDELEAGADSVFDAVEHWREAGGTLEVDNLALHWGHLQTAVRGTLVLDAEHNPRGALSASPDSPTQVAQLSNDATKTDSANKGAGFALLFADGNLRVSPDSGLVGAPR